MEVYTATIWQKDEFDPCTVAFDTREKAQNYKEQMEKIIRCRRGYVLSRDD